MPLPLKEESHWPPRDSVLKRSPVARVECGYLAVPTQLPESLLRRATAKFSSLNTLSRQEEGFPPSILTTLPWSRACCAYCRRVLRRGCSSMIIKRPAIRSSQTQPIRSGLKQTGLVSDRDKIMNRCGEVTHGSPASASAWRTEAVLLA